MTEHTPDLVFESIDVGGITITRLEQRDFAGESVTIDLHPVQLRLIAERAGLIQESRPAGFADWIRDNLERHVKILRKRFDEFYFNEFYHDEIWKRCGDAEAISLHLRAAWESLEEVVRDMEMLDSCRGTACTRGTPVQSSNEKSAGIIVTSSNASPSEPTKRGRPVTGEAMSNAERQKAHRERKAEQKSLPLPLSPNGHDKLQLPCPG